MSFDRDYSSFVTPRQSVGLAQDMDINLFVIVRQEMIAIEVLGAHCLIPKKSKKLVVN